MYKVVKIGQAAVALLVLAHTAITRVVDKVQEQQDKVMTVGTTLERQGQVEVVEFHVILVEQEFVVKVRVEDLRLVMEQEEEVELLVQEQQEHLLTQVQVEQEQLIPFPDVQLHIQVVEVVEVFIQLYLLEQVELAVEEQADQVLVVIAVMQELLILAAAAVDLQQYVEDHQQEVEQAVQE